MITRGGNGRRFDPRVEGSQDFVDGSGGYRRGSIGRFYAKSGTGDAERNTGPTDPLGRRREIKKG